MTFPAATRWDLETRDFELAADGHRVAVHPVDAEVVNRLGFRRGTIAGAPTIGHTIDKVRMGQGDEALREDVLRRQLASLGRLVLDGMVDSVSVEVEVTEHGRMMVRTHYRNTQTGQLAQVRT